jgi:hypothetical protein
MVIEIYVIQIAALMFVTEVPDQASRATAILREAIDQINRELPAIEATLGVATDEAA